MAILKEQKPICDISKNLQVNRETYNNTIKYILVDELSKRSGANYPHLCLSVGTYDEAIEHLNNPLNTPNVNRIEELPYDLEPLVITNDITLTLKFRQAFDFNEFKTWCGQKITQKENRRFYYNEIGTFHSGRYGDHNDDIIIIVESMFSNQISWAKMVAGSETDIYDDGYTSGFSESVYFNGWYIEDIQNENIELNANSEWWKNLDDYWKIVFKANCKRGHCSLNVPNEEFFIGIKEIKNLELRNEYSVFQARYSKTIHRPELTDLSPLLKLKNIEKLNLCCIDFLDKTPIFKLKSLKELNLQYTNMDNLEGIEHLVNLEILNISSTKITDILSLYMLENLQELDCSGLKINRLTPLKRIKKLNLKYTNITNSEIKKFQKLLGYEIEELIY